ncbi:hypothetical protein BHE74_00007059, partial [Ensete ventricosum]
GPPSLSLSHCCIGRPFLSQKPYPLSRVSTDPATHGEGRQSAAGEPIGVPIFVSIALRLRLGFPVALPLPIPFRVTLVLLLALAKRELAKPVPSAAEKEVSRYLLHDDCPRSPPLTGKSGHSPTPPPKKASPERYDYI